MKKLLTVLVIAAALTSCGGSGDAPKTDTATVVVDTTKTVIDSTTIKVDSTVKVAADSTKK